MADGHGNPAFPLAFAAQTVCRVCRDKLPDLSEAVILLPQPHAAEQLRREILHAAGQFGFSAVLLPRITTFPDFHKTLLPEPEPPVIAREQRVLILMEALRTRPDLYGSGSPWLLAENLLQLFDEITLFHVNLPKNSGDFVELLRKSYSLPANEPAMQREARLVHTLWKAWHEQLSAEGCQDSTGHYLSQLSASPGYVPASQPFFVLGFDRFIPAERRWLETLRERGQLHLLFSAPPDDPPLGSGLQKPFGFPPSPFSEWLETCYRAGETALKERINAFKLKYPHSPVAGRLKTLAVDQLEQETQGVALFIRASLARGYQRIGVVTEDRRLARRLRALLERSNISLRDTAGWALSTTRAAAVLESWLECVEQDFPHLAFLDLLKSPAITPADNKAKLALIYRLEHDVILHENIAGGIKRYQRALDYRAARLAHWNARSHQDLMKLLQDFEKAAAHLKLLLNKEVTASAWLELLIDSLEALNMTGFLSSDSAGSALLDLLTQMKHGAAKRAITLSWTEFRAWVGRSLEQHYFNPSSKSSHDVQLFTLEQSRLQHFDALVIAAANEHHLPGDLNGLPFFNEAVRASLGLPDWRHRLRARERQFRALLECSQSILITWQQSDNGEPIDLCPWVAALTHFHNAAYGDDLQDRALLAAINRGEWFPGITDEAVAPQIPQQPAPVAPVEQLPAEITVSGHQRLINCPYQFYVSDILKLKPADEIREALQKSDYGNRVHTCLEAFHAGLNGLPGPFEGPLTITNRNTALALLETISRHVFTRDIEDNFQHRGWLRRWLAFIPQYIDWQIDHNRTWRIEAAEQRLNVPLNEDLTLHGRIDRIEKHEGKTALVDYKTGKVPKPADVLAGEEVQLISYSLLLEHVSQVLYLGLDGREGVNDRTYVEGETLISLRDSVRDRLIHTYQRLRDGAPLPAFADKATCRYCDAAGVCRRQVWERVKKEYE